MEKQPNKSARERHRKERWWRQGTKKSVGIGNALRVTGSSLVFESKQLFGSEGLIVNLSSGLDEILQVGPREEVAEVHKFAVVLVLYIDNTPSVLTPTNRLAIDDDIAL